MEVVRRNYPGIPIVGPHHHAVRAGNILFLAGVTAKMTEAEQRDIAAQTDAVLRLVKHIVEAEGGTMDNVVKITNFVTDISADATEASRAARLKYFGENLPASTRVQVAGLVDPHLRIEIEATAVLRSARRRPTPPWHQARGAALTGAGTARARA